MDVWIGGSVDNRQRVMQAVRAFGFANASGDLLNEPDAVLRMGVPPLRIELLRQLSGVEFDDCWPRRITTEMDGLPIPLISLNDLKRNKKAAARPKDLVDLEELS